MDDGEQDGASLLLELLLAVRFQLLEPGEDALLEMALEILHERSFRFLLGKVRETHQFVTALCKLLVCLPLHVRCFVLTILHVFSFARKIPLALIEEFFALGDTFCECGDLLFAFLERSCALLFYLVSPLFSLRKELIGTLLGFEHLLLHFELE